MRPRWLVTWAVALFLWWHPMPSLAQSQSFDVWLEAFRTEALGSGIDPMVVDDALGGLQPLQEVIDLDRRQFRGGGTFQGYRERVLSSSRIANGQQLYREHRALLNEVSAQYGVQPRFIVALWGVESTYGAYKGQYPVIASLATLAWEGRRAAFFRSELLNALKIVDNGDIEVGLMLGSWAGAMGQSQFMPSSYLDRAVDFDGDGRRDIWTSLPDVFASIANYLSDFGWSDEYTWGRQVIPPASVEPQLMGLDARQRLDDWQRSGVRRLDGSDLPAVPIDASLIWTDERVGPAYLVYDNFRVLMRWNRSTFFGLTVGELSDRIRDG